MTSFDHSAAEPSIATQDPAGDVIAAPATATAATAGPITAQTAPHSSPASAPVHAAGSAAAPANGPQLADRAPIGQLRGTGACIALAFVTLGIYSIVWFYKVHSEMKSHTNGAGLGGGLAAVLALVVGIAMPFITSSEVGNLYRRAGMAAPVSGATGLWYMPGAFIVIGPLVWFVKTNAALNSYWRSLGAS